jgi:hypothetical protein
MLPLRRGGTILGLGRESKGQSVKFQGRVSNMTSKSRTFVEPRAVHGQAEPMQADRMGPIRQFHEQLIQGSVPEVIPQPPIVRVRTASWRLIRRCEITSEALHESV